MVNNAIEAHPRSFPFCRDDGRADLVGLASAGAVRPDRASQRRWCGDRGRSSYFGVQVYPVCCTALVHAALAGGGAGDGMDRTARCRPLWAGCMQHLSMDVLEHPKRDFLYHPPSLISEDYLHLNVWPRARPKTRKLPMISCIHGGGRVPV